MKAEAHSVETLLGMPANADTLLDLAYRIEDGLPVGALERLAGFVAPGDANFKYRLMPKPTFMRRKKSAGKRLTAEEGNKLARLAKVVSFALDIYKDPALARARASRPRRRRSSRRRPGSLLLFQRETRR